MNGHLVKYLFYEKTGKSQITIPKRILEINDFNWEHGDDIFIVAKTIDDQKGLFIWKREKKK